jgi:hypothetical protein
VVGSWVRRLVRRDSIPVPVLERGGWEIVALPPAQDVVTIQGLAVTGSPGGEVFLSTLLAGPEEGRVYRTTDAGATWAPVLEGRTRLLRSDGITAYTVIQANLVRFDSDTGTWVEVAAFGSPVTHLHVSERDGLILLSTEARPG